MIKTVITFIITSFIIPGFILYKLFGKKVAIGYVLLAYAFISLIGIGLRNTGPVALTEEYKKETNKYYIYSVLGGIAIFYVLNKYLK